MIRFRRHPNAMRVLGVRVEGTPSEIIDALTQFTGPHAMLEWGRPVLVHPDGFQRTYLDPGDVVMRGVDGQAEWDYYVVRATKLPRIWIEDK